NFAPGTIGPNGQAVGTGCVFPKNVNTIADQLQAAHKSWRDYNQSMGADPTRESKVCGHPPVGQQDKTESATPKDQYATRHNPFVYFHSVMDSKAYCDKHVVNLSLLPHDLKQVMTTPNFVFITPDLCGDGHDATGAVLHSPCIHTVTATHRTYNHNSMLRSIEDIFGLSHLGYTQLSGERSFGSDVFTRRCPHR